MDALAIVSRRRRHARVGEEGPARRLIHGLEAHPLYYIDYKMTHSTCSTKCCTRLIPQIHYTEIPNKIHIILYRLRWHCSLLSIVFALQLSNQTPPFLTHQCHVDFVGISNRCHVSWRKEYRMLTGVAV
jgi:hypothetical protein